MRVVVTGGLGYLGSHVVKHLLGLGHNVVTLDRAVPAAKRALMSGEHFVQADVLRPMEAEIGLIDHADAVIHLAALISAPQSVQKPELYYRVNFVGTMHALELAKQLGAGRFVLASSAAVYGPDCTLPVTEDQVRARTENPYGASKLFSESLVRDYCSVNGIAYSNLRLFNLIGADRSLGVVPENGSLFTTVTHLMARAKKTGTEATLTVYGDQHPTEDGTAVRDFVHVADVAEAMSLSLLQGEHSFTVNIGSGGATSIRQVAAAAGIEKLNVLPVRPGELSASCADITQARAILEWEPQNTCISKALAQEYSIRISGKS